MNPRSNLKSSRKPELRERLLVRDGSHCWLCDEPMTFGDPDHPRACTIEHLWNASEGGPNTMGNLVLCCFGCNQRMRNMSLVEKIKLRDTLFEEREPYATREWGNPTADFHTLTENH